MNFTQHRIASGIIAAAAVYICWLSFTQSPAEAYVFPRIISVVMVMTALITFVKALLLRTKVGDGLTMEMAKNILPGLIVAFVYFFWGAKNLGFYTSTTIAFFVLLTIYDPSPNSEMKTWLKRVLITAGFIAVMYALFAVVLSVYTPRGMFL